MSNKPSLVPNPGQPRLPKTEQDRLDRQLYDDIVSGDQSWRATVVERFAAHLEEKARRYRENAEKMASLLGQGRDGEARISIERFKAMAVENDFRARQIRANPSLLTDPVKAEMMMRPLP